MHPVDRHELLRERVRNAVVVRRRAGDTANHLVPRLATVLPIEPLAEQAVPVGPHPEHRCRVGDDRGSPVDRVDLRHQRGDDEPCLLIELLVGQLRILRVKAVADGVVLAHEQRVEQRKADPEVAGHAPEVDVRIELWRRQAVGAELQLAELVRPNRVCELGCAAVDLRAVPPVRVGGDERRWACRPPDSDPEACGRPASGSVAMGRRPASGISQDVAGSLSPWLNQSWTSNWIHAPASRFRVVAGSKVSRVSNSRLIRRGFGSSSLGSSSGQVCSSGTFRPNRLPIEPINGSSRSL